MHTNFKIGDTLLLTMYLSKILIGAVINEAGHCAAHSGTRRSVGVFRSPIYRYILKDIQVRRNFFIDSDFSHNYLLTPYVFVRLSPEQFRSTFAIFLSLTSTKNKITIRKNSKSPNVIFGSI